MLFGKFRILGKLVLLIIVPLLGVVALSIPIVVNRVTAAQQAQEIADRVTLASKVGTATQELQEERLLSVGFRFGLVDAAELALQSARSVDAVARISDGDPDMPVALQRALRNTSKLDNTRQNVLNLAVGPDVIVGEFTAAITPMISGLALSANADLTTAVGRQLYALDQALRTDDLISQSSGHLTSAVVTKNLGMIGLFYTSLVQLQQAIGNAQPFFTEAQYRLYLGAQDAFNARVGLDFTQLAASSPGQAVQLVNIKTLFPSLRSVQVLGGFVEKRIAADVNTIVSNNRNAALRDAGLIGGGTIVLLLLVIALSIFMARAVARPLRRLTTSADLIARAAESELERVADDDAEAVRPIRLDPVDVAAQDEIGDLARAFDRVQGTAVRLVERQVLGRRNVAQMFAHVGRRTQNLVGRQLALIDNLERRETDSERLGELYRLDHMSSRLRRNASSLVVLSGGTGADEHMAPLPLSDVVRLALGEIEDYTRVDVDMPEDLMIVPAVLADLVLVLAELMENATIFSPPHTRVTVSADDLRGGARLAVVDHGLGMAPERMTEENARLTRRERLDLAPTEVLGLFVVGRLARRHGIEVTLTETAGGGVTVWVDLTPAHLLPRTRDALPGRNPSGGEVAQAIAGSAARAAVPGSRQPYDPQVVDRASRTLADGRSWAAFTPLRAIEAVPAGADADGVPVYDADPYPLVVPEPAVHEVPAGFLTPPASYVEPTHAGFDLGAPVAGRVPAALPSAEPQPWTVPPVPRDTAWAPAIPRQRTAEEDYRYGVPAAPTPAAPTPATAPGEHGLRRRVPGSQLPVDTAVPKAAGPPTAADAIAARASVEAFEAGVLQADLESADDSGPLIRRVPGASLPQDAPAAPPPVAAPSALDPDAARALMEEFEYGVALALNETQPLPEGQPR